MKTTQRIAIATLKQRGRKRLARKIGGGKLLRRILGKEEVGRVVIRFPVEQVDWDQYKKKLLRDVQNGISQVDALVDKQDLSPDAEVHVAPDSSGVNIIVFDNVV